MERYDIVIVGGGPASLAAAIAAKQAGAERLLILGVNSELGGILNQCIHNGFGLHTFGEAHRPRYAARYIRQVRELEIPAGSTPWCWIFPPTVSLPSPAWTAVCGRSRPVPCASGHGLPRAAPGGAEHSVTVRRASTPPAQPNASGEHGGLLCRP